MVVAAEELLLPLMMLVGAVVVVVFVDRLQRGAWRRHDRHTAARNRAAAARIDSFTTRLEEW